MNLGQTIHTHRLSKRLSQHQLARLSGIAQPNLSAYERGTRQPSLASLRRLAKALDLPWHALLQKPEPPSLRRFDLERLALALRANKPPAGLQAGLFADLRVLFHPKLRALFHAPGPWPRIKPGAAYRRLQARLGKDLLAGINRRLSLHASLAGGKT